MKDMDEKIEKIKRLTDDEIVFALAMKYDNDLEKVAEAMMNNKVMQTDELFGYINSANEKYVTHNSSDYPRVLKVVDKPPVVVFYDGNLEACQNADLMMFNGLFGTDKRGFLFVAEDENGECDWLIGCEKQEHLNDFAEKVLNDFAIFNFKDYTKDNDLTMH